MMTHLSMLPYRNFLRGIWLPAALFGTLLLSGCLKQTGEKEVAIRSVDELIPVSENQPSQVNQEGTMPEKTKLSEEDWKKKLTVEQYRVLRLKGTERPFTNEYDEHFEPGVYACAACGAELFESDTKFHSGCGWPAFYAAKAGNNVELHPDRSHGMVRTEVTCAHCDSHLGHIFDDAPQTPTGQRYCINSVSLKFIPRPKSP